MDAKMWWDLKRQVEEIFQREDSGTLQDVGCISGEILWRMTELEKGNIHSLDVDQRKELCPKCRSFTAVQTNQKAFVEVGEYCDASESYEEEGEVTQYQCENSSCGRVFYMS